MNAASCARLELRFSAVNLKNRDTFSKSDPRVVVLMHVDGTKSKIGSTEVIQNNLNPTWKTAVVVEYKFWMQQEIEFRVMDSDSDHNDKQQTIGTSRMLLSDIVRTPGLIVSQELVRHEHRDQGTIVVSAVQLANVDVSVKIEFSGHHLDKKDLFGKSDPYFVLSARKNERLAEIHRSEVIQKTLDPIWQPVQLPLVAINNADMNQPLVFDCYDWDKSSAHDLIGSFEASLAQMQSPGFEIALKNVKHHNKESGRVRAKVEMWSERSFFEYLMGGCELSLIVAVDFSIKNGDMLEPESLHFLLGQNDPNNYVNAIEAVGNILMPYDRDGMIPVYGFGGKFNGETYTNQCFPLTTVPTKPEVNGVEGIVDVYYDTLGTVEQSSPANLENVLRTACDIAGQYQPGRPQKWFTLLILTAGMIGDIHRVQEMLKNVVPGSPLSVIIVGIGKADFAALKNLAGEVPDIVQFVQLNDHHKAPEALAAATVQRIPHQLVSWMKRFKVQPNPLPPPPSSYVVIAQQPGSTF